jgi:hypothetical protein
VASTATRISGTPVSLMGRLAAYTGAAARGAPPSGPEERFRAEHGHRDAGQIPGGREAQVPRLPRRLVLGVGPVQRLDLPQPGRGPQHPVPDPQHLVRRRAPSARAKTDRSTAKFSEIRCTPSAGAASPR